MEAQIILHWACSPWTRAVWWLPMPTSPRLPPQTLLLGIVLKSAQHSLLTATGAPRRGYWIVHCLVFGDERAQPRVKEWSLGHTSCTPLTMLSCSHAVWLPTPTLGGPCPLAWQSPAV